MSDEKLDLTSDDEVTRDADAENATDADENVFEDTPDEPSVDDDLTLEDVQDTDAAEAYEDEVQADDLDASDTLNEDLYSVEEGGASLSSRILTWLVLMLAGAGIALWGGPKIAPNLPQWAAPLAKVLTPGGDVALQEVESLRTDVTAQLADLPAPVDADAISTAAKLVAQDVAQQGDAALATRIDAVEAALNDASQTDMIARVSQLETRLEGVTAEVETLNNTLSEAITTGGDMSAETLAQLAAKDAVIDGLRAELNAISGQLGTLSQRIEDVDEASQSRIAAATAEVRSAEEQAADRARELALQDHLNTLTFAAESGRAYQAELEEFASFSGATIPEVIASNAPIGLPHITQLEEDFTKAAHTAIRESIKSEAGDGTLSRVSAFFQSQVATRSLEPQDGSGTDAILSRAGAALAAGDLGTVLSETDGLSETAKAPLASVLNKIRLRHNVLTAIAGLSATAS